MKLTKLRLAAASIASVVALALAGPNVGQSLATDRINIAPTSGKTAQAFNVIPDGDGVALRSGYRTAEHNHSTIKGGTLSLDASRLLFDDDTNFSEDHELDLPKVPETFGYYTGDSFWPDLSAESFNDADLPNLKINITKVTGPGKVYLWSTEDRSAVLDNDAYEMTAGTAISFPQKRIATDWFFTRAGDYHVTAFVERTGENPARSAASTLELRVIQNHADTVSAANNQGEPADHDGDDHDGHDNDGHDHDGHDHDGNDHDGNDHDVATPRTPTRPEDMGKLYSGHLDVFYVNTNTDGSLNLQMKEDITGRSVLRPADSAILMMGRDWYTDQLKWNNLPAELSSGYVSPNTSARYMLYPGWSSNDYTRRGYSDLSLKFVNIKAPAGGKVALFHSTLTPGVAAADLQDGSFIINPGSQLDIHPSGHKHFTWIFSHPGLYQMTVKVVGKHHGQPFESRPSIYTWYAQTDQEDQPDLSTISNEIDEADASDHTDDAGNTPSSTPESTTEPTPPSADDPVTLDHGHVDLFYVSAEGGQLKLQSKEDVTGLGMIRPAKNLTLRVGENAKLEIPEAYRQQLAPEGYFLSQSGDKQNTQLFPGWDTNDVRPDFDKISLKFVGVEGPGRVFLFQNDELGGGIVPTLTALATGFRSVPATEGNFELNLGDSIVQPTPGHAHVNWLFEKPGTYVMKVQAEGVHLVTGKTVRSPVATYTWKVGDPVVTPEASVEATAEATVEASPEESPEATAETTVEANPEATPDSTGEPTVETNPENGNSSTPDSTVTAEPSTTVESPVSAGGSASGLPKTGAGNISTVGGLAALLLLAGFGALFYRRKQLLS
ncbi:choice-of-anchor M domain-containing protein [Boudabousia marimammalium]|uniref:Gram-positive cocci surface proteins LPxTG domain-containing protein n=1 Tax=Boudabousia marimammalium TaxID=156892 RepID=A0A1Q5PJV3_9ACTO|nr:choice-of-anchor M domain-containing protein [Boudabousia marimammalium]OKL46221.1 hypothetical protein BM477_07260 [Boudabousia marimammalium]